VESLHKTLPSYTQTAVLHVADSEWVDLARVQRYLGIYQTSSPSYVLMAGMDRCTRILLKSGGELFVAFEKRLQRFYQACKNLQRVLVFSDVGADFGIWDKDRSKILICAEKAGYNGQELYDLLLNQYHLQMEMASGHYVTALTSIMDTDAGFERLWKALSDIDGAKKAASGQQNILTPEGMYRPVEKQMEIYQAMDAPKQKVELMKSAEMISAEFIYLYPPGIPMAAPGEVISEEMLQILAVCQQRGMQVQGMEDTQGKYLFTIV
jgi:arginine/lysine/ornithine decarboxylase